MRQPNHMNPMQTKFKNLLVDIRRATGADFSGIGLVIYEYIDQLPIIDLRESAPDTNQSLVPLLAEISSSSSQYHDGFHFLNLEWEITHVSQYFSPPIISSIPLDRSRQIGGRYVAALFGSAIDGVKMCGIISKKIGISIFENGKEVHNETFA